MSQWAKRSIITVNAIRNLLFDLLRTVTYQGGGVLGLPRNRGDRRRRRCVMLSQLAP